MFHIRALKNILYLYKIVFPVALFSYTTDVSILLICLYFVFIYEWHLRFLHQWLARCLGSYVPLFRRNMLKIGAVQSPINTYLTHPSIQPHVTQHNIHTNCCLYTKCMMGFRLGRLRVWILEYCDYHTLTLILLTWRIWWAPHNASRRQMGFNLAFKGLNMDITVLCKWLPVADSL